MSAHLNFLEVARTDLNAAKHLLSKKDHSNAVFHLQQAVEKGVKSLGLWLNVLSEEECKDRKIAGHDAFRIFNLLVEEGVKKIKSELQSIYSKHPEIEQTSLWQKLKKQLSELEEEIKNIRNEVDRIEKEAINIASSDKEIQEVIRKINRFRGKLPKGLLKFGGDAIRTSRELYRMLTQDLGKIKRISPTDFRKIKGASVLFFRLIYSVACLFYLSLIMSPHAVRTRYPEKDWNPIREYNERMPLVKKLGVLINAVKEAIDNLFEVYAKGLQLGDF